MIDLTQDIHPLTDFKNKTPEFTRRIKETGKPLVLTINGKPELVVHDVESFQQYQEFLDQRQSLDSLRIALKDVKAGRGRSAAEVHKKIRKKHGIPG